jgi:hypothetical protein
MKLGCSGYLTKKMRMKTSLKPYMLFLEEKNIFAKRFEKKYLIPHKRQLKLIKNITTAHPILRIESWKSLN